MYNSNMYEEAQNDSFECETGVTVSEMLGLNLQIPDYQRPYKWKEKNVSELFYDIKEAMDKGIDTYRIGTIILHTEENSSNIKYNIVDGQQRILTIGILLNVLGDLEQPKKLYLLDDSAKITRCSIFKNKEKIKKLVQSISDRKKEFCNYLKENCKFVKITTKSQEQAFQFFDSQNNSGKELELYDILKAYHLREMAHVSIPETYKIVDKWQKSERKLRCLFNDYLYPIKQWAKSKNENTSIWEMDDKNKSRFFEIFKGVKNESNYNFTKYHLSANREFRQIDMPIISGEFFFQDIFYYLRIQQNVESLSDNYFKEILAEFNGIGDQYINDMMNCALLFIAVKFGIDKIEKDSTIRNKIFAWAWSLRLYHQKIKKETVNNYAKGNNNTRINNNVEMFAAISDAVDIRQIPEMELESPDKNGIEAWSSKILKQSKNLKLLNFILENGDI